MGWCKKYYNLQQILLNLIFWMAFIFKNSTKSSRHWMNKLTSYSYIYLLSPLLKNELFQILDAGWKLMFNLSFQNPPQVFCWVEGWWYVHPVRPQKWTSGLRCMFWVIIVLPGDLGYGEMVASSVLYFTVHLWIHDAISERLYFVHGLSSGFLRGQKPCIPLLWGVWHRKHLPQFDFLWWFSQLLNLHANFLQLLSSLNALDEMLTSVDGLDIASHKSNLYELLEDICDSI